MSEPPMVAYGYDEDDVSFFGILKRYWVGLLLMVIVILYLIMEKLRI